VAARVGGVAAAEHEVRDVHVWQAAEDSYRFHYGVPLAARYLAWLVDHTDYSLSDIEAEVANHATRPDDGSDPDESEPERDSDGAEQAQASTETN